MQIANWHFFKNNLKYWKFELLTFLKILLHIVWRICKCIGRYLKFIFSKKIKIIFLSNIWTTKYSVHFLSETNHILLTLFFKFINKICALKWRSLNNLNSHLWLFRARGSRNEDLLTNCKKFYNLYIRCVSKFKV